MTKSETARQAAIDRVGDSYVYGAWDQPCTPANRNKYAALSHEYADAIRAQCPRQSGKKSTCKGCKYEGKRIHDCRGLTSACAGAAGIQIRGQTVARQWAEDVWIAKGEITTLPKDAKYAQLFRHNGSKWAHTGIYIGNGETVDARGHAYGVIRKQLGQYKWTHWAVPRGMDEDAPTEPTGGDGVIYSAIVTTKSGSLNVRSGPGTSYIKTGSLPKGEKIDILMEYDLDGDGVPEWAFFGGDGKQGYVSLQYLTKVEEPTSSVTPDGVTPSPEGKAYGVEPDGLRFGVFVPCESRDAAEALKKAHPGAIMTAYKPPDE